VHWKDALLAPATMAQKLKGMRCGGGVLQDVASVV
jgi:hypothetical protein